MIHIFSRLTTCRTYLLRLLASTFPTAFNILSTHRSLFKTFQKSYWTLAALSTLLTLIFPSLQVRLLAETELSQWSLGRHTSQAIDNGNIPLASALIFGVNLLGGSMGSITLPTLIFPFAGVVVACIRALTWGCLFAPVRKEDVSLPHFVTVGLEGQAYVIASVGAWVFSMGLMSDLRGIMGYKKETKEMRGGCDEKERSERRWVGVKQGWIVMKGLYGLVSAILAVSAVWEAVELVVWPSP